MGAATVVSVLAVGLLSYLQTAEQLRSEASDKLGALTEARQQALSSYIGSIQEDLATVAAGHIAEMALEELGPGFDELGFNAEAALRAAYVTDNPNAAGERHKLDRAADGTSYSLAHGRFHPWFRQFGEARGYYDIFLIAPDGDVVYSVYKEMDFATNLRRGAWRESDLAEVFEEAVKSADPSATAFADFQPYEPSAGAAASFIATPVVRQGRVLGVLAFQMPIGRINEIMQSSVGMGESGETYLVGSDYLMRSDSRFASESTILKTEVETASVKSALAGESGVQESVDYRGVPVLSAYRRVDVAGVPWAVVGEVDLKEILAPVDRMKTIILVIGLGILAVVGLLGWLAARSISRPLMEMTGVMNRLAGGDMSAEVPGTGRGDEVGQMATSVQVFKESMINAERLRAEQEEMKQQAEAEKRTAMNKLADDFQSAIGAIVDTVSSSATELNATSTAMAGTAEETTRQATAVAAASEQASQNVQTVASAADELNASVEEIGRQVSESTQIAGQAVGEAETTNVAVRGLAEAAEKIDRVVQIISDIAEQTNLLALNATIEAARAGDAGKGFAVVAAEVKALATQTGKATEEIAAQIEAMQSATDQSVGRIEAISQTISRMSEIATAIASAVEEQGAATREIARNVQEAATGTSEVSSNISGVRQAASETGSGASQVQSAASELAQQGETLKVQVAQFLDNVRAA
ncbi:methyl-accepting chemotaxis protein [Afifella pfennigii]|uniref:methyl-accepting chemotaxis protein n=1 Tax=Afifella pfennigii TaxID=209897 RepID=UPI00146FB23B|nr:methyl-accepting chemotaxis protein [Afifella pfennigii]